MIRNKKGFTLMEILLVLLLMGILTSMIPMLSKGLYGQILLRTTANETKAALHLAQQLSIDESTSYCVELLNHKLRVRHHVVGGKVVMVQELNKSIAIAPESHTQISYNADGVTTYGHFVFMNHKRKKIKIQVALGTGKVKITELN